MPKDRYMRQQIAFFVASDGAAVIGPDGARPFFGVPIAGLLPENRGFIRQARDVSAGAAECVSLTRDRGHV